MPDALANLGDALAASGDYERAKTTFEQLVDRQPDSDSAKRKLNGVLRKMGLLAPDAEEESEPPVEDLKTEVPKAPTPALRADVSGFGPEIQAKPAAGPAEPQLDDETQKFIAQSLTDVDLFASYGLTQKAIGLLEAILRRAPRHTPTIEKLLDFVLGAGDDRRTAELAAQLEQIHTEAGDQRSAERFAELRRRFQRAAGISDEELAGAAPAAQQAAPEAPQEMGIPEVAAIPAEKEPAPATRPAQPPVAGAQPEPVEAAAASTKAEVQEVDLSDEWATLLEESHQAAPKVEAPPPPPAKPPATPPRPATPAHIEEFQVHEKPAIPPAQVPAAALDAAGKTPAPAIPMEEISTAGKPKEKSAPKAPPKPPQAAEPEFEMEQEYELVLEQEDLVPAHDQKPPQVPSVPLPPQAVGQNKSAAPPVADGGFESDQFLADLAKEIDQLGIDSLAPTFSSSKTGVPALPVSKPPAAPPPAAESGPLKEVFEEFRAELGEMGAEDEDLETHYNLGIAFREMGLLEEAISEFQKVAKASDRGRAFRYTMQCCTLLGLAFMEKGQPAIAAIWYERALKTPGIDPESTLALRYDLGVAQESAGEPVAALKSFSQVYAMNIDYRDVAERIAALQKPTR